MGKVLAAASMSLDGYIAKHDSTIGRLFDWYQNGDVEISTPAAKITFHLSPPSAEHWRRWTSEVGVLVCGRALFDFTDGWDGMFDLNIPVVVVTHEVPTDWVDAHPAAPFLRHGRCRCRGRPGAGNRGRPHRLGERRHDRASAWSLDCSTRWPSTLFPS